MARSCWLALLIIRVVEHTTAETWRNVRPEVDRLHLVTLAIGDEQVAQRLLTMPGQANIPTMLELPEPPRFLDFTVTSTSEEQPGRD